MAQQYFSIQLPTKPFLKKYLESCYGVPIQFGIDNYFGMIIACVLEKNVYPDRSKEIIYKQFDRYTITANIYLPFSWLKHYRYGTGVEKNKAVYINKLIELDFKKDLYYFVQLNTNRDKRYSGYDKSLIDFANFHNIVIDEDITMDSLKKIEYRYRQDFKDKYQRNLSTQKPRYIQQVLL